MNTAAIRRPELVAEVADRFGSQVLVLSVDARRPPGTDSGFEVTTTAAARPPGSTRSSGPPGGWVRGEILLNAMDADGTQDGFDLELIAAVRREVSIPVIASGVPERAVEHFPPAVDAGADAVLAATVFHFGTCGSARSRQVWPAAGPPGAVRSRACRGDPRSFTGGRACRDGEVPRGFEGRAYDFATVRHPDPAPRRHLAGTPQRPRFRLRSPPATRRIPPTTRPRRRRPPRPSA